MVSFGNVTFVRGDLNDRLGQGEGKAEQSGAWISVQVSNGKERGKC